LQHMRLCRAGRRRRRQHPGGFIPSTGTTRFCLRKRKKSSSPALLGQRPLCDWSSIGRCSTCLS